MDSEVTDERFTILHNENGTESVVLPQVVKTFQRCPWRTMGLESEVVAALEELDYDTPLPMQIVGIKSGMDKDSDEAILLEAGFGQLDSYRGFTGR